MVEQLHRVGRFVVFVDTEDVLSVLRPSLKSILIADPFGSCGFLIRIRKCRIVGVKGEQVTGGIFSPNPIECRDQLGIVFISGNLLSCEIGGYSLSLQPHKLMLRRIYNMQGLDHLMFCK
jgi:hypothetical protein